MTTGPHTERFATGVLVIGAGAAGLRASIEIARTSIAAAPQAIVARARDTHRSSAAGRLLE